jgi:hypothetical protein
MSSVYPLREYSLGREYGERTIGLPDSISNAVTGESPVTARESRALPSHGRQGKRDQELGDRATECAGGSKTNLSVYQKALQDLKK